MMTNECSYCEKESISDCPQCKMPYCEICLAVHLDNTDGIDLCPQQQLDLEVLRQTYPINLEISDKTKFDDSL
jgi:hypothetical protein